MVTIKNVAVVGASGAFGVPLLNAIIDSAKFNVTVISRESSKATFPSSVKVIKADYSSLASLTSAFRGQDAVVSTVGTEGFLSQPLMIDAAISAGVKRFVPSEFGSDLSNPNVAKLPVFGYKIATRKHIEEKIHAGAEITYTYVVNGAFLDWGINVGFLLNWKEGKPELFNGGDREFSATSLKSVGRAVVGVLENYEETKNRTVYVQERTISQNRLLEIAKKVNPEKKWEPVPVQIADVKKGSDEKMAKGEDIGNAMHGYIFVAIFDEAYGGKFEKLDNELLGVSTSTDVELEAVFKKLLV